HVPRLLFYYRPGNTLVFVADFLALESHPWLTMLIRTPLLLLYILMVFRIEHVTLRSLLPIKK
ncbi:MAG: hypothetical protein K2I24_09105, partial [Duncaniella sp.]|nr:hypothetical protein [Duncaniella sp.]